nr:MAG TPA: hypothetical protein [Crassvirales sp.]
MSHVQMKYNNLILLWLCYRQTDKLLRIHWIYFNTVL